MAIKEVVVSAVFASIGAIFFLAGIFLYIKDDFVRRIEDWRFERHMRWLQRPLFNCYHCWNNEPDRIVRVVGSDPPRYFCRHCEQPVEAWQALESPGE